jgi:hypothetical protein
MKRAEDRLADHLIPARLFDLARNLLRGLHSIPVAPAAERPPEHPYYWLACVLTGDRY